MNKKHLLIKLLVSLCHGNKARYIPARNHVSVPARTLIGITANERELFTADYAKEGTNDDLTVDVSGYEDRFDNAKTSSQRVLEMVEVDLKKQADDEYEDQFSFDAEDINKLFSRMDSNNPVVAQSKAILASITGTDNMSNEDRARKRDTPKMIAILAELIAHDGAKYDVDTMETTINYTAYYRLTGFDKNLVDRYAIQNPKYRNLVVHGFRIPTLYNPLLVICMDDTGLDGKFVNNGVYEVADPRIISWNDMDDKMVKVKSSDGEVVECMAERFAQAE